eukprot:271870_1
MTEFLEWKFECVGIGWSAMRNHKYAVSSFIYEEYERKIQVDERAMPRTAGYIRAEKRRRPPGTGADPISQDKIREILDSIQKDETLSPNDNLIWSTAVTLAWIGIKRASEYTGDVQWHQIEFENNTNRDDWHQSSYFILNRKKGKTFQFGANLFAVFVCTCDDLEFCCLCNMVLLRYNRLRENQSIEPDEQVFEFTDGSTLTYQRLLDFLKGHGVLPHGMRKGGAQFQIETGVPLPSILKQGDWKSMQTLSNYNRNASKRTQVAIYRDKLGKQTNKSRKEREKEKEKKKKKGKTSMTLRSNKRRY